VTRVLVCGSRSWDDAQTIRARLSTLPVGSTIVTGGARGADQLAESIARSLGFDVETHRADWKRHGKHAGFVRNLKMLDTRPDLVLAFHDGRSTGTQHTIDEARRRRLRLVIVPSRKET